MELKDMSFDEKKELATKLGVKFSWNTGEETLTKNIEDVQNLPVDPVDPEEEEEEKKVQMEMFYRGSLSTIDVLESKVEVHKKHGWKIV